MTRKRPRVSTGSNLDAPMDVIPETLPPPPASTTSSTYRQRWVTPQGTVTDIQQRTGFQLATSLDFIKGAFQAALEHASASKDPDAHHRTMRNLFLGVLHVADPDQLSVIIANEPDFLELIESSGIPPPPSPAAVPGPSKGKEREAPPASPAPTPKALPPKAKPASAAKPKPKSFAAAAKAAPASAAVNPPKFNPSPKVASPMRAKRGGISSAAFKPATPIAPDAQASGYATIQHVNRLLAPFHFQLKGLVWSPFGNLIATPNSPQFVEKSKEVLPGIFLDMFKVAFAPLSFDDRSNVVVYNLPLGSADRWTDPSAMASLLMAQNDIAEPIPIESARWLANPARHKGATASLRLSLPPQLRAAILKSGTLFLEGRSHPVRSFTAPKTLPNQCRKCWKLGHSEAWCRKAAPVCGVCCAGHPTSHHQAVAPNAPHLCTLCKGAHPSWTRWCVDRHIQLAAQPPLKKPTPAKKRAGKVPPNPPPP
ncbi:hypothetical protein BOTBODRAFT_175952 [Botryobasidium botryosum FD-172 SS1]|uniref:Uncharacterized protein n=1 Tax=Botryobasidium botryosum (strain FD-172 SS1) TaxID=930990 RepID=A0A067MEF3_BOTB1|nr:hypothetical protein BOTBODRAFT_175952 [Botryobasidium botryosum FD-172 SS1]